MRDIQRANLEFAHTKAPLAGHIIECGVYKGESLSWLAHIANENQQVFGFDSFAGLPENWVVSDTNTIRAGRWKCTPPNIIGAELCVGMFADTLPVWKNEHPGRIALLHIDSDLYSSAVTVLEELNDQIVPGTIIVFDEIYENGGHKNWEEGEYKAFQEWQEKHGREVYELHKTETGQATYRILS